ncbi:hypothetical protein GCM10009830_19640 [Glycomyces endophyticus]|uniref:Uncharacterized protein n=1 Tax=Glycomyces endophyticus TaxID=480996 RepID=A0ABP4SIM2_9ACTN
MVIMSPAVPSESAKPDPIAVSRPIGRISVVTIVKMPIITATTAGQARRSASTSVGLGAREVRMLGCVLSGAGSGCSPTSPAAAPERWPRCDVNDARPCDPERRRVNPAPLLPAVLPSYRRRSAWRATRARLPHEALHHCWRPWSWTK